MQVEAIVDFELFNHLNSIYFKNVFLCILGEIKRFNVFQNSGLRPDQNVEANAARNGYPTCVRRCSGAIAAEARGQSKGGRGQSKV